MYKEVDLTEFGTTVNDLTEVVIEEWKASHPKYCAVALKNWNDDTKAKIVFISSRKKAYDKFVSTYKNLADMGYIVI